MAGGGVGEAMLIGAAVGATAGGAGAAIQGGDPLKGALLGGAMGGIGGGIGGALTPTATVLPTATTPAMTGVAGLGGSVGTGITAALPTAATTPAMTGVAGLGGSVGTGSIFSGAAPGVNAATNLGGAIASGTPAVGGGYGAFSAGMPPITSTAPIFSGLETAGAGGASAAVAPTVQASGVSTTPSIMDMFRAVPKPDLTQDANAQTAAKNIFGQTLGQPGVLSNKALGLTAAGGALAGMSAGPSLRGVFPEDEYDGPLSKLKYDPDKFSPSNPVYAPGSVYTPTYAAEGGIMQAFQSGGPVERMSQMNTAMNPQGGLYPMGMMDKTQYATPTQRPVSAEMVSEMPAYERSNPMLMAKGGIARYDVGGMVDPSMGMAARRQSSQQSTGSQGIDALMGNKKRIMTPEQMSAVALQGMSKDAIQDIYGEMAAKDLAKGGPAGNKDMAAVDAYVAAAQGGDMASVMAKAQAGDYNAMIALNKVRKTPNQNYAKGGQLGGYSDGGRMLKGPGDGMSDSIPGVIANKQPARLADGEFVVPADVVSHLGNGSTDAGAKQLYAMMNRVRKARTGNSKQGKQIKPAKYMAA
jgi:hypothetical protein